MQFDVTVSCFWKCSHSKILTAVLWKNKEAISLAIQKPRTEKTMSNASDRWINHIKSMYYKLNEKSTSWEYLIKQIYSFQVSKRLYKDSEHLNPSIPKPMVNTRIKDTSAPPSMPVGNFSVTLAFHHNRSSYFFTI